MSPADYYQLNIELTWLYNSAFEFWLTITFAFLIAVHLTFASLERRLAYLMLLIYGVAASVFTIRFTIGVQSVQRLFQDAAANGIPRAPYAPDDWQANIVLLPIILLMVIGTMVSIYFASRSISRRDSHI